VLLHAGVHVLVPLNRTAESARQPADKGRADLALLGVCRRSLQCRMGSRQLTKTMDEVKRSIKVQIAASSKCHSEK
jgi:hypothetical protein